MLKKEEEEEGKLLYKSLKLLGLESSEVTEEQVKKAYRQKAKELHPDKTKECTEDVFDNINKAYMFMMTYVSLISKRPGSLHQDFLMFNGKLALSTAEKNRHKLELQDILMPIYVTLDEVFQGVEKKLEYFQIKYCVPCNGTGICLSKDTLSCLECKGGGYIIKKNGSTTIRTQCNCIKNIENRITICTHCQGLKHEKVVKEVTFPVGSKVGFIDFPDMGHSIRKDLNPGLLRIVIKELEHKHFKRDGCHMVANCSITPFEAWCGFRKKLKLLHKESVIVSTLRDPPIVHGTRKIIPNMGFYINPQLRGDLIVQWNISATSHRSILATLFGFLCSLAFLTR